MELEVPEKVGKAFRAAYRQSLKAGFRVLIVHQGKLVEVSPDLKRRQIRSVAHPAMIPKGTMFKMVRPPISSS